MNWMFSRKRFPEFGKEIKREYDVASPCYDCRRFIRGCKGLKAGLKTGQKFACSKVDWYKVIKAE